MGQAEKVLRAHSRDIGQRQQLVHAKLHQGHSPTKAAGEHTLSPTQAAGKAFRLRECAFSECYFDKNCQHNIKTLDVVIFLRTHHHPSKLQMDTHHHLSKLQVSTHHVVLD